MASPRGAQEGPGAVASCGPGFAPRQRLMVEWGQWNLVEVRVHVGRYRYRIGARMRTILRYLPEDGEPVLRSLLVRMIQDDFLVTRQAAHQSLNRLLAQGLVVEVDGDEVALASRLRTAPGSRRL